MDGKSSNTKNKKFGNDFLFFLNKIKNNEHFALSRWGDGELSILENKKLDLRRKGNGEFLFDPNIKEYQEYRNQLMNAYTYHDIDYYVGIACRCCVGNEKHEYMKKLSKQNESNLTWANIFVNSNYNNFLKYYVEEFSNHSIIGVFNTKSKPENLSFKIDRTYKVGTNAWINDYYLVDEIKRDVINIKNHIFLIAAGPLANILVYELWKINKENIYLDIGSVFDTQLGMKAVRGYHFGASTLKKTCIW
jgi:hypothetical protein